MCYTMTIGWVTFGFIWRKPMMMVVVRSEPGSTFGIIEAASEFTVTIPVVDMRKEIAFVGMAGNAGQV